VLTILRSAASISSSLCACARFDLGAGHGGQRGLGEDAAGLAKPAISVRMS
jgi:hypothetical protein